MPRRVPAVVTTLSRFAAEHPEQLRWSCQAPSPRTPDSSRLSPRRHRSARRALPAQTPSFQCAQRTSQQVVVVEARLEKRRGPEIHLTGKTMCLRLRQCVREHVGQLDVPIALVQHREPDEDVLGVREIVAEDRAHMVEERPATYFRRYATAQPTGCSSCRRTPSARGRRTAAGKIEHFTIEIRDPAREAANRRLALARCRQGAQRETTHFTTASASRRSLRPHRQHGAEG